MPTFDFDAARRERLAAYDPVAFKLGGVTFKCKPAIPTEALFLALESEGRHKAGEVFRHACRFVAECLLDPAKDGPRWEKALTNRTEPVEEADVYGVVRKLVEVYAGRPTSPSSASSAGRRRNGATSNGKASAHSRTRAGSAG